MVLWALRRLHVVTVSSPRFTTPGAQGHLRVPGAHAWHSDQRRGVDYPRLRGLRILRGPLPEKAFPPSRASPRLTHNWNPSSLPPLEKVSHRAAKRARSPRLSQKLSSDSCCWHGCFSFRAIPFLMLGPGRCLSACRAIPACTGLVDILLVDHRAECAATGLEDHRPRSRHVASTQPPIRQIVFKVLGVIPIADSAHSTATTFTSCSRIPPVDQARVRP